MVRLIIGCFLAVALSGQTPDPQALLRHGIELQQQGDFEGALSAFRQYVALRPQEVAPRSNLGVLLARLGHYDEAIVEYRAALALDPGNASIELNLGLAYYKSGRIPAAAEEFSKVRQKEPQSPQPALLLADCRLRMGQNKEVIALLRPLEHDSPNDLGIAYLLGTALLRDKQIDEGKQQVDKILRNGDTAEARFLLGSQMFASQDYPAAVKQFASAIELNPNLPGLQAFYGQALLNTGDPEAATAAFRKELGTDPNNFSANLYLAEILIAGKKWDDAQPLLTRALEIQPDSSSAKDDLQRAKKHRDFAPSSVATGPRVGDPAPEFTAIRAASKTRATLHQLLAAKPLVLVFGSYTCPNFRDAADSLSKLYAEYKDQINFDLIYIREAHSAKDWQSTRNERQGVALRPANTMAERQEHASLCVRQLKLPFPALLDEMNGAAEKAYAAWPSRVYVIDRQGKILFNSGLTQFEFRPELLQAAIVQADPEGHRLQSLVQDAIAKQHAGDLKDAASEYVEFLKSNPKAAAIHSNLGACLAGLGKFSEAVAEYKIALAQSPTLPGVGLNLALAYYKMGHLDDAAQELLQVHKQIPKDGRVTLLLADCYLGLGKNKEVIGLLQPIEREQPDNLAIAFLLGTALIRDNQADQGQVLVDRILRNGDSAPAHLMLGSAKMQAKDFAGAREEFAKAEALDGNAPEVHVLYGQALEATGDPDGAVKEFTAELATDPNNFEANLAMGVLLRQDQKFDEALGFLSRALLVRPGDMGVRYQMATIALSQNKVDEARGELESIVNESPRFTEAHVSLATAYFRLKRPADGNKERQIVQKLTDESQAAQPGAKAQ